MADYDTVVGADPGGFVDGFTELLVSLGVDRSLLLGVKVGRGSILLTISVLGPEMADLIGQLISQGLLAMKVGEDTISAIVPAPSVIMALSNLGFPLPKDSPTGLGFGFTVGSRSSGRLTLSVGPVNASNSYPLPRQAAVSVRAVAVTTAQVYADQPVVRLVVQVMDADMNVQTLPARVSMTVTGDSALLQASNTQPTASCIPASDTGICTLTSSALPSAWFALPGPNLATVHYQLDGTGPSIPLGAPLQLHRAPGTSVTENVLAIMPQRTVLPGETVRIPVYGHAGAFSIRSFWVEMVSLSPLLRLQSIQFDDQVWSSLISTETNSISILATPNPDPPVPRPSSSQGPELLFTVTALVAASVPQAQTASVTVNLKFLSSYERVVADTGSPLVPLVADRTGTSSTGNGTVYVAPDAIVGMLGHTAQGELVNQAVLSGRAQSFPVTLLAVRTSGRLTNLLGLVGIFFSEANNK
jgi:hypothetical protein